MAYSSIKIFMPECDGLSWLETNILVTKFWPPQTKNPSSAPGSSGRKK